MNTFASNLTAILTNIFSSASKLVFLMIAMTICVGFFTGKLTQDNFMYIATSVFSYYFGLAVGSVPTSPPGAPRSEGNPSGPIPMTTSETKTVGPPSVPGVK